jgi:NTE family protein
MASDTNIVEHDDRARGDDDPLDGAKLEQGMALALSGGGFKAAMYHLGALYRLNELGVLRRLKRISSVSGGSIAAGVLARHWAELSWSTTNGRERADNFHERVARPLIEFCSKRGVDAPAAAVGLLLPFRTSADELEAAYDKHLYEGKTLQDLPKEDDAPRFVFNATNLGLNTLWRFCRAYAADHRVGAIDNPDIPLAKVVAASSGFPPFFSPVVLDLSKHQLRPLAGADRHIEPYIDRVELADGGIYDNMGLEAIWKRYKTLIVCNAGDPTKETPNPADDWFHQMRRTISFMHRQAENNRVRWLMSMGASGARSVVYMPLRGMPQAHGDPGALSLDAAEARRAMEEDVRLWKLERTALERLVRHGYAQASAAAAKWLPTPAGLAWGPAPKAAWPALDL